jgi:hypothetical protein
MPKPMAGEPRNEYMSRCVPEVMKEGLTQEQAVGKCEGMFSHAEKLTKVNKSIQNIDRLIREQEHIDLVAKYQHEIMKAQTVEGYESPEPGDLEEAGKNLLAKVYASCRKDGGDKEYCSKVAWTAVKNAGYKSLSRTMIMKAIANNMKRLAELSKDQKEETIEAGLDATAPSIQTNNVTEERPAESVMKAGAPPGTRHQRADGTYIKQQTGEWTREGKQGGTSKPEQENKPNGESKEPPTKQKTNAKELLDSYETSPDVIEADSIIKHQNIDDAPAKILEIMADENFNIDEKVKTIRPQRIDIDDLISTQDSVSKKTVEKYIDKDSIAPINIIEYEGKKYIVDGHHRAIAEKLKGNNIIKAKLLHIGNENTPAPKAEHKKLSI